MTTIAQESEFTENTVKNLRYSYAHVPTINKFSRSDKFIRYLQGPFGSGKSSGCCIEVTKRAIAQRPGRDGVRRSRWAVVRNTYPMLRDTTIKTFMGAEDGSSDGWFPQRFFGRYNKTEHAFTMDFEVPGIGRIVNEVLFRALDKPDDVRNLLSLELTGAWINEAREIPYDIFDALQGRVRRYPSAQDGGSSWFGVIMDSNPPDTDHWIYKLFEEQRPENCASFRQPSGIGPKAENLPNLLGGADYYKNLALGKSQDFIRVYIHGDYGYVRDGKPIYPQYSDSLHLAKSNLKPIPNLPITLGWDFGLTPACIITQLTARGQFLVLREFVAQDMGIKRLANEIVKPILNTEFRGIPVQSFGDPAGRQRAQTDELTCYQLLEDAGIVSEPSVTNSLIARIEAVETLLARRIGSDEPAFLLDPRCTVLRKGFLGKYRYRRMQVSGDARYADQPEKNAYSHPHDALQYAAMNINKPILTSPQQVIAQAGIPASSPPIGGWT